MWLGDLSSAVVETVQDLWLVTLELLILSLVTIAILYVVRRLWRGSFRQDHWIGLSSESFNLDENITSNDRRSGLATGAKLKILLYMIVHAESFDEARARYMQRSFAANNIGPDGRPRDPKAISWN